MHKMKPINCTLVFTMTLWGAVATFSTVAEESLTQELREAKKDLTEESHLLEYKYEPGEVLTYMIEHLATIDTTISGNNQKTKLRTKSTRSLHVKDVNDEGHAEFVHIVDAVDMWSEVAGREPVRFNSETDEEPPIEFGEVKKTIGIPLSTITMDRSGRIVDRVNNVVHPEFGLGGLSIPLPQKEVKVGYQWAQPLELKVRLESNRIKSIKTRQVYRLEKVETGVATISVKTEVLTPINSPRIESQLVQRISKGQLRFDVDAGRLLSKQLDWDENVLGFNGPESNMKYLARSTESLEDRQATARKDSDAQTE